MEKTQITPERITKPIQLLGAWLVGLLAVDGAFLLAGTHMDASSWQSSALIIAAIVNVPIFIGALFLLQTKFRPELQEDSYYATYLNSRTNEPIKIRKNETSHNELIFNEIEKRLESLERNTSKKSTLHTPASKLSQLKFGINVHLLNKDKILSELGALGVLGVTEFGQHSEAPEILKVAISEDTSKSDLEDILRVSRKLGFTHYGFIEFFEEIQEDVLFGAYGDNGLRLIAPL